MSLLSGLKTDNTIKQEVDVLGGRGPLESGVYDMVIESAYMDESKGGAINVNFTFKDAQGRTLKQTIYVTSGNAKGKKNYYEDKNGDRQYLPGFNVVNSISLLTVGKEIGELETTPKMVSIYDWDAKKELPQEKEVLMDLCGQEITLGVLKVIEDKNVANSQGVYVPSGDTRTINEIGKVFRTEDKLTVAEIRSETAEAEFFESWKNKNTGKDYNKAKGAKGGAKPVATTGASAGGSLFPS